MRDRQQGSEEFMNDPQDVASGLGTLPYAFAPARA